MDLRTTLPLRTGREMPVLGLGTWELKHDTAGTIQRALQLGYPMIDTSGDYGTQPGIGKGVAAAQVTRTSFYLVTKVEETDDAYQATQKNLAELGLDHANLMLIHRPPKDGVGEELWRGLMRARDDGLTKDIGVSNYSVAQLRQLIQQTGEVPVVNQIEWTPFGHSQHMLTYCQDHGIIIQAYSSLTRGERLDDDTVQRIASVHGKTPAQVLIRWNLQLGTVPIVKANRPEHLEQNLDVFNFELTAADMQQLNHLNESWSALGDAPKYLQPA